MEIILAGVKGNEIENISYADFDVDLGSSNDFELVINRKNWSENFKKNCRVFVPGGEFGGMIGGISTSTSQDAIAYTGRTWRGMLDKKAIQPPKGEDYRIISGELNAILKELIEPEFPGLFYAETDNTGIWVENYQFERYCTLLYGINKMLQSVNHRLKIMYIQGERGQPGFVKVAGVPIVDYSEEIELSQDNRLDFTMEECWNGVNHLICLGKGELKERTVLHLYVQADGSIGQTPYYTGTEEITEVYDYTSGDENELENNGRKRLSEIMNRKKFEMDVAALELDVDIGDIIGGRDYITGLSMQKPVTGKILTWKDGKEQLEYRIEGDE